MPISKHIRLIGHIGSKGTAMENLAKWLEIQLKPYATMYEAYIKDTKSILLHLEHLNNMRAPFKEGTKLIRLDVENYYPNCQTDLCIQPVRTTLEKYATEFSDSKIECIFEITTSSNNGKVLDRNFTQINGATIGGPKSASVTDIFGAIYMDRAVNEGNSQLHPSDWKHYRDDRCDIEEDCDENQIHDFTEYLKKLY